MRNAASSGEGVPSRGIFGCVPWWGLSAPVKPLITTAEVMPAEAHPFTPACCEIAVRGWGHAGQVAAIVNYPFRNGHRPAAC